MGLFNNLTFYIKKTPYPLYYKTKKTMISSHKILVSKFQQT